MSDEKQPTERSLTGALVRAATTAGYAPSVHNTQPWRWRVLPDLLELSAAPERRLAATDPEGRLLMISCGTALHHARTVLAAEGWAVTVHRLPDPSRPELLATLTGAGRTPAAPDVMRLVQCMPVRHTDRRPVSDEPVPDEALDAIVRAAAAEGTQFHVLGADQVMDLAAAAGRAAAAEAEDPEVHDELAYWTGVGTPAGTGLPAGVLPERPQRTTVPGRDFGRPGTLPTGTGHDQAARYGMLFGDEDLPESWLVAGEALSAAWLTATAKGVSMVPLSGVVEVPGTRQALRQMLAGLGHPYLVVRLGIADPEHAGPPHPPRLPADQVVDTSAAREQRG